MLQLPMTLEEAQKTHPGFTVICQQCGCSAVQIQSSLGWSPESGGWGSIDLKCLVCDQTEAIYE